MVLVNMLMEIDPLSMRGSLVMTIDMSPTYLLFLMLFLLFWTLICMI